MKKKTKVLLVGLGILGGGLSLALWLLKHGFHLTITDTKSKKELAPSLKKLNKYFPQIKLVLGKHRLNDILKNDLIILNQAVPVLNNPLVAFAQKHKKPIMKELELFFEYVKQPIIGITGTRGKTTTTLWAHHLLKAKFPQIQVGGNNPDYPLFSFINKLKKNIPVVLEIPCFQLELPPTKAPHLAVITNLYTDHLNRYHNLKQYAQIKANIFKYQTKDDYLILNYDNPWTKYFLSLKPKAQIYFTSLKKLPQNLSGVYLHNNWIVYRKNKHSEKIINAKDFIALWGLHNTDNLLRAIAVSKIFQLSNQQIKKQIASLPQVKMRQEIIFHNKKLTIINDSAGTSPEATEQVLERFKNKNLILIAGGTDKNLDFFNLAKTIKKILPAKNLILLNGSATQKLVTQLNRKHYSAHYNVLETLNECFSYALYLAKKKQNNVIVFSPGAASFEKFKNEFDRGAKFNQIVKKYLK
ncbi:MAG: UDP-N-acetylmuramoyl-L-alanine--D-glutamate ligase [Parcubacteria group bacterium]|nr:UDP-N-acetylmuramoyl-L-alanine--D-glutamate ligase [Parcubacteria group bacterium]